MANLDAENDIAIVGMSCRLPGDVSTLNSFWELMSSKKNAWSEIPSSRFNKDAFYHPNPDRIGTFHNKGGYFLHEDPMLFDAPFFNISGPEATAMDPQGRILLEVTYEALENAGIPKEAIAGKEVGVYIGETSSDYAIYVSQATDSLPRHHTTGVASAMLSNRISYFYDLRGPSLTISSACSSSLSALHLACESLRSGDNEMAIVGACHLNLSPLMMISMSTLGIISEHGQSTAYDQRASGFGKGEGAGCLILKRLKDAIEAGDHVHAVIAGTGANQDGRTRGITLPSEAAQEEIIRRVYEKFSLNPQDTGFVEGHGTGTQAGDQSETAALHAVFSETRSSKSPLWLGSVKSNIGHLEGASGVISVIKAALMLARGWILPNGNFVRSNPEIPFEDWKIKVPTNQLPWPRDKKYISVSNFGIGGANALVVLKQTPQIQTRQAYDVWLHDQQCKADSNKLFVFTTGDKSAMNDHLKQASKWLLQSDLSQSNILSRLAYTLVERRSIMPWRVAIAARSVEELVAHLENEPPVPLRAHVKHPKISFVFTGQEHSRHALPLHQSQKIGGLFADKGLGEGAQWHAMGRELMAYPVYAETLKSLDEYVRSLGASFSLLDELAKGADTSLLKSPEIAQPACAAIQICLVKLLASWGLAPDSVIGHSSGEIAAAYTAGILTMHQAMFIAFHRGLIAAKFRKSYPEMKGGMLAVGMPLDDISPLLDALHGGRIDIACVNSATSVTVSGDENTISELQRTLDKLGHFSRRLRVDIAYHSYHMKLIAHNYRLALGEVAPATLCAQNTSFFSSLLGKKADTEAFTTDYWVKNLTNPVQFAQALQDLLISEADNPHILIEIGPHSALQGPIKHSLKSISLSGHSNIEYFATLVRNVDATDSALLLASNLFVRGVPLKLHEINFSQTKHVPKFLDDLFTYPWQHITPYRHLSRTTRNYLYHRFPRSDFIGHLNESSNSIEPFWTNILRVEDLPWLSHHQFQKMNVFPMAGFLAMAMEASAQRAAARNFEFEEYLFRNVRVEKPLTTSDEVSVEIMIQLRAYGEGVWDEFSISATTNGQDWTEHCKGMISVRNTIANPVTEEQQAANTRKETADLISSINEACTMIVETSETYEASAKSGIAFGPTFKGVSNVRSSPDGETNPVAAGIATVSRTADVMPHGFEHNFPIHPSTLDMCVQLAWVMLDAAKATGSHLHIPNFLKEGIISKHTPKEPGRQLYVYGSCMSSPIIRGRPSSFSIFASDPQNIERQVVTLRGLVVIPVNTWLGETASGEKDRCVRISRIAIEEESAGATTDGSIAQDCDATQKKGTLAIICNNANTMVDIPTLEEETRTQWNAAPYVGDLAGCQADNKTCIILDDARYPILRHMTESFFRNFQSMVAKCNGLLWVTYGAIDGQNPDAALVLGMSRTIRSETTLPFVTLDLDFEQRLDNINAAKLVSLVLRKSFLSNTENFDKEIVERSGKCTVPRLMSDSLTSNVVEQYQSRQSTDFGNRVLTTQKFVQPGRPLKLAINLPGSLDTLFFEDDATYAQPLREDEIEILVQAAAVNFKDVMIAMGQIPMDYLGQECSGTITRIGTGVQKLVVGDRVTALAQGSFATYTRCPTAMAAKIPESLSCEVASIIPIIYGTAYYCLRSIANLRKGESVLIHAGAGGVGQAAIQTAQYVGADIFATVGSKEKKDFLVSQYGLNPEHIFFSRDTSFGHELRNATKGKGVDVILNSLAGDALRASWECIAHFGRFVEIGKKDIVNNRKIEMSPFAFNATFSSFDMSVLARERPDTMEKLLLDVLKLFDEGVLTPLILNVTPISEIENAFRLLQSGKGFNKYVIRSGPEEKVNAVVPQLKDNLFNPNATYFLAGGAGGIGRSLTRYMVQKGAKNIFLLSRSSKIRPSVESLIHDMSQLGANVVYRSCDICSKEEVEKVVHEVNCQLCPIRGVIQCTMVLDDCVFEQTSYASFKAAQAPKIQGTWNLHNALLETTLDFFIALSSVSGVIGSKGQASYAGANTFIDSFMAYRRSLQLPGTSIALAAVQGVGFLAENESTGALLAGVLGTHDVLESEIHALVAAAVTDQLHSCQHSAIIGLKVQPNNNKADFFQNDPRFQLLKETALLSSTEGTKEQPKSQASFESRLAMESSFDDAAKLLQELLTVKLAAVLMVSPEELNTHASVSSLGVDSLALMEIRNWIMRQAEANFQLLELMAMNVIEVSREVLKRSKLASATKLCKLDDDKQLM